MAHGDEVVTFRVLLSNDVVYRFQCLPTQQIRVVWDHIHEASPVSKHRLCHCRTLASLDGHETIGDTISDGDVLTMDVDAPRREVATTVCLDGDASVLSPRHLYPHVDVEDEDETLLRSPPSVAPPPSSPPSTLHPRAASPDRDETNQADEVPGSDMDRWRKAHVRRIEANSASLNLSPLEMEHNTRISHHDLMLHAALELTENALTLQHDLRMIYLYLRSHQGASAVVHEGASKLLGLIKSTDRRPVFLHPSMDVAMHGYVDCGKWGALWRTKHRCWAVLWDAKLSLFPSPDAARKYMFALANDRRTTTDDDVDLAKRIQKEYAPHTEFRLAGWSVRAGAPECDRHTFALFDDAGTLRQVVDVASKQETDAWVQAIAFQAQQHLVRLRAKLATASAQAYLHLLRLTGEDGEPVLQLTPPLKLRVPLKWLHVHLESQDATTRARRLKCSNFAQALKDIQRDVLRINGRLYASSCFEDMLSELAIELLQHASVQTKTSEMDALAFARQLLIHSSRTHGGGDILDAVHYLLHTPHYLLCPEMSDAAPVELEIQLIDGKTVVEIEMALVFKLIPIASENCIGRIVGVSRQRAICDMTTHFEVDGDIRIEVEKADL